MRKLSKSGMGKLEGPWVERKRQLQGPKKDLTLRELAQGVHSEEERTSYRHSDAFVAGSIRHQSPSVATLDRK